MNEIMSYFIRSGLILTVLYSLYWTFLRKDTYYQVHRYYLLVSLLLSVFIPLLRIPVLNHGDAVYSLMLEPIVITPGLVAGKVQSSVTIWNLVPFVYFTGVGFLILRLSKQILNLARLVRKYGVTSYEGQKLVLVKEEYVPFSIFNLIFIRGEHMGKAGFDRIIEHEKAHIDQHHSLDLVLMEFFIILQWFNPFLWLIRGALKDIHEYQADRKVLAVCHDPREYQQLLLNQTFGVQFITLSNNLNQSLTKRRFIMMSKKRNMGMSTVRMIVVFPAALALAMLFTLHSGEQVLAQEHDLALKEAGSSASPATALTSPAPQEEPVYTVVEQMPEYPGGQEALVQYMMNNIKYPENAGKNGIQGTVFVTFVVGKDGSISNAKVLRGVDKELDEEALRVINGMPNWKPGKEKGKPVKVQFNLPVAYKLDADAGKKVPKESAPDSFIDVKKGKDK